MAKRLGYVWFTGRADPRGRATIGIVLAKDLVTGELKAWISSVDGRNEEEDLQSIEDWGAKFPVDEAISIIVAYGTINPYISSTTWEIAIRSRKKQEPNAP